MNRFIDEDDDGFRFGLISNIQLLGSQYCIGSCTGLANGTIYFEYQLILMYRFEFTTIYIIYIFISQILYNLLTKFNIFY